MRKVAETGILPCLNTSSAHREPGIDVVGAGVLRGPEKCPVLGLQDKCFAEAFEAVREW